MRYTAPVLVIGTLLLILGAAAAGYYWGGMSQTSLVIQLQNERDLLQSQLTATQSQAAALASEKQLLMQQVSELSAKIAQLNATIASLSKGEPSILAVRFSPKGGCADQVAYWIDRANSSVHVLIYSFSLDSIGDALTRAYQRGVDVKAVFEKSQIRSYSELFRLTAAGIPARNDTNPGDMHEKVAIIDGYIVLVGSFNWSAAAENENNEVLLVIRSADLAGTMEREFQRIWTTGR
jgi:phosphatidylserine/phosphatidylglycerophosphate/cardiolipin synthase-like enzyme